MKNALGWLDASADTDRRPYRQTHGAPTGSTTTGDTLCIKVYQALASALNMAHEGRKIVLSDSGNFPTDLYRAQGLLKTMDKGHELRIVDPEAVSDALCEEIAVLMLPHVDYRPGDGIERLRVGTPSIIQLAALEVALDAWEGVDLQDIRVKSIALSELFISEVETRCPQLTLASPRDLAQRGSQVSFRFEHGYAAIQAQIARDMIGDFRAPDIMRFGFTPLYLDEADIIAATKILQDIMDNDA